MSRAPHSPLPDYPILSACRRARRRPEGRTTRGAGGSARRDATVGLVQAVLPVLLMLAVPAEAARSMGHLRPTCVFPRTGWNEEVLRARDAAIRECRENLVRQASDRKAVLPSPAQDEFWRLKRAHDDLLRKDH